MAEQRLEILWQRVVVGAQTCVRCGDTGGSVRRAAEALRTELAPLGVAVTLAEKTLSPFGQGGVEESNRVFFNGRPLEDILGARVGMNHCQSCCELLGERTDCRTLIVDGAEHEALPEELIVRAGRIAARGLLNP